MTCCFEEERRKPSQKLRPMRRTALYINVIHRYIYIYIHMYVCMYLYIYTYNIYIYVYINICIYIRTHTCICAHTHPCFSISLSLSLSLFLFLCISVHQCHHSLRALLEVLAGHKLPKTKKTDDTRSAQRKRSGDEFHVEAKRQRQEPQSGFEVPLRCLL